MFTLILQSSSETQEIYSYISKKNILQNMKKDNNSIIFEFDNFDAECKKFSLLLSNMIIDLYEKKLIKKIIKKNYFYFDEFEQIQISNISSSLKFLVLSYNFLPTYGFIDIFVTILGKGILFISTFI